MDPRLAWALIVLLAVLHQDFWAWDDPTLVGGAVPIGLAWQIGVSVAASGAWLLVTRFAWPTDPAAHRGAVDEVQP